MRGILEAVKTLVEEEPDIEFIWPVHPNPTVRTLAIEMLGNHERIHLTKPLSYVNNVHLMNRSFLILTDSGGIQEEAPSLGKPLLVLRTATERTEGIERGCAKLVGVGKDNIINETRNLLHNKDDYLRMSKIKNPYGDGKACERIVLRTISLLNCLKEFDPDA